MIRAVLFEPEGTLFEPGYGAVRYFGALARRWVDAAGRGRQDEDAMARRLLALQAECGSSGEIYGRFVAEFGLPARARGVLEREHAEGWARMARALDGAGLVLDRLGRRGYQLGLVAEGGVREHAARLELAGWAERFDTLLVSEAQGTARVEAQVFARALDCLGLVAREVACVAATRARVLEVARAEGLHTVWVGGDFSQGISWSDLRLRRLDELVEALDGLEPVRAA
jgi:FMN phosphatase YigB (HAD superfamily)